MTAQLPKCMLATTKWEVALDRHETLKAIEAAATPATTIGLRMNDLVKGADKVPAPPHLPRLLATWMRTDPSL